MPRFEPFAGVRFDTARIDLADVTAPPYDVIDEVERERLATLSAHNVVRVDLPREEGDELDRYEVASRLYHRWMEEGALLRDEGPSLYLYRMGYQDEAGRDRSTTGVIGALELEPPGAGDVLPHEHTTPKAKSDRLALLRACDANLSPIWGLSLAEGLSDLCEAGDKPTADCVDELGVQHCIWRISDPVRIKAVTAAVASAEVVIADGHHRYETALAYRDERRAATGAAGPWDLVMMYVVELAESQLSVRPIHRLLSGFPAGFDLPAALGEHFDVLAGGDADMAISKRMLDVGALGLVLPAGDTWLLRPRADRLPGVRDIDAERFDLARASLPPHEIVYQHGTDNVLRLVEKGEAQAGVLLRPVPVPQIAAVAHARDRMPPKSTYFFPKPRTGMVLRSLAR